MKQKGFSPILVVISILIILAGFLSWFFLIGSVPKSYAECLKTRTNGYTRDELMCSFSPGNPAEQKLCEQKDGIINQFKQCLIVYYNPDFKFPENLEDCGKKIGFLDMNKTTCDVQIDNSGSYDTQLSNSLIRECIKKGGQKIDDGCWMRFTSGGIDFNPSQQQEAIPETETIPQENISGEQKNPVYKNTDFSFKYDPFLRLAGQNSNKVSWEDDYFGANSMTLEWQNQPFQYPKENETTNFDENKQIEIQGKPAKSYIYSCGLDCYYHEVYFEHNGKYFLLKKNIAGGGTEGRFQALLSSFNFKEGG